MSKEVVLNRYQEKIVSEITKRLKNSRYSNTKLGGCYSWSITAGTSCPGKTKFCSGRKKKGGKNSFCYAINLQNRRPSVRKSWARNFEIAKRKDFDILFSKALASLEEGILRLHTSGDIFSADYARALKSAFKDNPHIKPFGFTRSWRIPEIKQAIEEDGNPDWLMASIDPETGEGPSGWRIADIADVSMHDIRKKRVKKPLFLCNEQLTDVNNPIHQSCSDCGRCPLWKIDKHNNLVQLGSRAREVGVVFSKH